jgi:hypothetical protein
MVHLMRRFLEHGILIATWELSSQSPPGVTAYLTRTGKSYFRFERAGQKEVIQWCRLKRVPSHPPPDPAAVLPLQLPLQRPSRSRTQNTHRRQSHWCLLPCQKKGAVGQRHQGQATRKGDVGQCQQAQMTWKGTVGQFQQGQGTWKLEGARACAYVGTQNRRAQGSSSRRSGVVS